MKQKVVMKVSMNGPKSRSKAMKTVAGVPGIVSVALEGEEKNQVVVTGEGFDSIALTTLIRKKVGFAELVSVSPVEEKKEDKSEAEVQPHVWATYPIGNPQYLYTYETHATNPECCTVM